MQSILLTADNGHQAADNTPEAQRYTGYMAAYLKEREALSAKKKAEKPVALPANPPEDLGNNYIAGGTKAQAVKKATYGSQSMSDAAFAKMKNNNGENQSPKNNQAQ